MRGKAFQAFVLLSALALAACGTTSGSSRAGAAASASPWTSPAQPAAPLSVYIGSTTGTLFALRPGDGSVRWRYQAPCACQVEAQALANGVVYASASLNPTGSPMSTHLYALAASDGSVRWQITTPGAARFTAVIQSTAYITLGAPSDDPSQHNEMQARDARDGSLLWHTPIEGTGDLAATMVGGTIYLASFDSQRYYFDEHRWTAFYALNAANGTIRWHQSLGASDSILAVAEGQLYAMEGQTDVVCSSNVVARNASDGTARWAFPKVTQDVWECESLIGTAHNLVYGLANYQHDPSVRSSVYALNAADGSSRWQITLPFRADTGLLANGALYLPAQDALAAYAASDGSSLWRAAGEGGHLSFINGVLYTSRWGQSLDALNPATGALRWRYQTRDTLSLSTQANGTLYGLSVHLVTASAWQQDLVALNAANGTLLWRFPLGTSAATPLVG